VALLEAIMASESRAVSRSRVRRHQAGNAVGTIKAADCSSRRAPAEMRMNFGRSGGFFK